MTLPRHHRSRLMLAFGALLVAGCGPSDNYQGSSTDRQARIAMNVLATFYGDYLEAHRGNPPKTNDEFQQYLQSRSESLQRYNVEKPAQLLISLRDEQPLVIVCGKRRAPADSPGTPWAAYEQSGFDGNRMAVRVRGGVHELSDADIARIFQ